MCFDSQKVEDLLVGEKITKDEKMALIALTRLIIEKDAIIAKKEIEIAKKETDIAGFVSDLKAALSKLQDLQPRALLGTHSAFRFSFSSLLFLISS